ncbi:MAG: hypothetical protein HXX16_12665 [Bacteroidales bacterium]|nr:hypothetical protein [Bacteroidales bacterium]
MKCFNHPTIDAIGICKNCNKGLCKDCLTEVENGIACTSTCIEEVKLINSLIKRNKKSYKTASGAYYRNAFIYAFFGLVFIVFGIISDGLMAFTIIIGVVFFIGAALSVNSGRKYNKEE